MSDVFDRRGVHLVIQTVRFLIAGGLWCVTLIYGTLGLARFSRVFTGDVAFGALDGFQFAEAMYGAFWRVLLSVVSGWGVWKVLQWDPGGRRSASAAVRDGRAALAVQHSGIDHSDERVCPLLVAIGVPRPGDLRRCPLLESKHEGRRHERLVARTLAA